MIVLRAVRVVVVGAVLAVCLTLAAFGPSVLLYWFAQPHSRVLGTLAFAPVVALVVGTVSGARRLAGAANDAMLPPDDAVRAAAACRAAGLPAPVCVVGRPGARPGAVRGLRRLYVVAEGEAWADPTGDVVAALARDLRSGDALVAPLLGAVGGVHQAWRESWQFVTTAVRPGRLSVLERLVPFGPPLLLAPVVGVGLVASWVAVQLARLVVPRALVERIIGWFATDEARPRRREVVVGADDGVMFDHAAYARTEVVEVPASGRRRSWWTTPAALAEGYAGPIVAGPVAVVVLTLVVWGGALASGGAYLAERLVWPGERSVAGTVVAVQQSGDPDGSLLGRLGVPIGVTYDATARTADGDERVLASGSTPVAVGDELTVVVSDDHGWSGASARSRTQDSVADLAIMGALILLFGAGVLRVVWDAASTTTGQVTWSEYEQGRATGRRVRRPRLPWVTMYER